MDLFGNFMVYLVLIAHTIKHIVYLAVTCAMQAQRINDPQNPKPKNLGFSFSK